MEDQEIANLKADVRMFKSQRDGAQDRVKILEKAWEDELRLRRQADAKVYAAQSELKKIKDAFKVLLELAKEVEK